jgi:hypothetical protein
MINYQQITPFDFCGQLQFVLCQPVVDFGLGHAYRPRPMFPVILLLYQFEIPRAFRSPPD